VLFRSGTLIARNPCCNAVKWRPTTTDFAGTFMKHIVDDVRIKEIKELSPPAHLLREFPASEPAAATTFDARGAIHRILHGSDDRLLVVVGPCSIHDYDAAIVCSECEKVRVIDVTKIISNKNLINLRCKCKCGNVFHTVIERRRFYRKNIKFHGNCYPKKEESRIPVLITDISRSGMKFEHKSLYKFSIDDELHIDFFLDDPEKSLINKVVIIRSIAKNGSVIGAEFKSPEHYDKLGGYLLYNS
jgi:hypothetical protein